MRPAHPNMYGQPAYLLPPNPVQFYNAANSAVPQYVRSSQELAQPQLQQQQQQQPMYLVPQMHQYPALVGMPTQVMGNPIPQAMAMQGVPAGWAYRPPMAEPAPVWGYGGRGYNEQQQQQQLEVRNWQAAPSQGYPGPGVGFQGRVEGHGNGGGAFQGRADGHGNGSGNFQGRAGNVPSFVGRASSGEVMEPARVFENGRFQSSGGRNQYMNRQALPPQSAAPLQSRHLKCEPCEKTFAVYAQFTAHMNTHVPCDDPGCSFSASGKVVKEHKLTVHCKPSNSIPVRATFKRSKESIAEIKAWREERRRNYPTRLNIQRKKDILEGRVARGELIEEDARKRRQRMKEILARQAELGCPVAEVPDCYLPNKDDHAQGRRLSDRRKPSPASTVHESGLKKRKLGGGAPTLATPSASGDPPSKSARVSSSAALPTQSECEQVKVAPPEAAAAGSQPLVSKAPIARCAFYPRGRCRKGYRCPFLHTRGKTHGGRGRGRRGGGEGEGGEEEGAHQGIAGLVKKRPPTLLAKLLQGEITRDKSYILQCLRFFVNNNFLVDGIVESASEDESSDYSEGEVVEAPDVLLADSEIIKTLLAERPEVVAKVMEVETHT